MNSGYIPITQPPPVPYYSNNYVNPFRGPRYNTRRKPLPKKTAEKIVKKVAKPKKPAAVFDLNTMFMDLVGSLRSALTKPEIIIMLMVIFACVISIYYDWPNSFIGKWAKENSASNSFAKWLDSNYKKFFGMLIFAPAVFDLPKKIVGYGLMGSVFWCLLVPEHSIYEYVVQAMCLHTFFKVKLYQTRLMLVGVVIFSWFAGFFVFKMDPGSLKTPNSTKLG